MGSATENKVQEFFGKDIAPDTQLRLHHGLLEKKTETGFAPDEKLNDHLHHVISERLGTSEEHVCGVLPKDALRFLERFHELSGEPIPGSNECVAPAADWANHFEHFCTTYIPPRQAGSTPPKSQGSGATGLGILAAGVALGVGGTMAFNALTEEKPNPWVIHADARDMQGFIYPRELNNLSTEQLRSPEQIAGALGVPPNDRMLYAIHYPRGVLMVLRDDQQTIDAGARCIELCRMATRAADVPPGFHSR